MDFGRAPGSDMFMAEYLKLGGPLLFEEVFTLIRSIWHRALQSVPGNEAESVPSHWLEGTIIPLWKQKGDRRNKNTWRGITLLSVGSKLLARVCAARLGRWSHPWLNSMQFGFRQGTGVDDVQQITRALLEEASGSVHDKVFAFRFFDLEKA